jgi:hypothetical protein
LARRWVRRWDGFANGADLGNAIAVTGAGSVYVAGQTARVLSSGDAVVLKYAGNGTLEWRRAKTSPGAFYDEFKDVALLGNGDLAATGHYYGGVLNGDDVYLARFTPTGSTRWERSYNGPGNLGISGERVAPGPKGALYVAGFGFTADTGGDILTLKYSGAGGFRWARPYSSAGIASDYISALLVRGTGVYVAGSQAAAASLDGTLLKYLP